MNGFIFNGDVVLHLLLVVAGIMACFAAGAVMVFLFVRFVERDCRKEILFDENGSR